MTGHPPPSCGEPPQPATWLTQADVDANTSWVRTLYTPALTDPPPPDEQTPSPRLTLPGGDDADAQASASHARRRLT